MSEAVSAVGHLLRECRTRTGKSIADMAKDLGVNYNTLGSYERGTTQPDVDFLAHFAAETRCDFRELLVARLEGLSSEAGRRALEDLFQGPVSPNPQPGPSAVDQDLLGKILEEVEKGLSRLGIHPPSEKKAQVIALLYDYFSGSQPFDSRRVEKVLRLVA